MTVYLDIKQICSITKWLWENEWTCTRRVIICIYNIQMFDVEFNIFIYLYFFHFLPSLFVSLVVSEEPVWRDPFYNGNVIKERGKSELEK